MFHVEQTCRRGKSLTGGKVGGVHWFGVRSWHRLTRTRLACGDEVAASRRDHAPVTPKRHAGSAWMGRRTKTVPLALPDSENPGTRIPLLRWVPSTMP